MYKLCLIISEQNLATQIKVANYYRDKGCKVHLIIADRINCYENHQKIIRLIKSFGHDNNFTFLNLAEKNTVEKWDGANLREKVDWIFLESFEQRYLKNFGLQRLIRCDFSVSNDFHDSSLYRFPNNFSLRMKYLEECIHESLLAFESLKDYVFISIGAGGLKPVLLHLIATANGCKSFALESTRIEDKWMLFDSFTIGPISDMKNRMRSISDEDASISISKMALMLNNEGQPYAGHIDTINQSKQSDIANLGKYYMWLIKHWLSLNALTFNKGKSKLAQKISTLFMPNLRSSVLYATQNFLRKKIYDINPRLNHLPPENIKYFYFSLHTMPESNTVLHSSNLDELTIIKNVLMKIPVGYFLLVKLPPRMRLITGGYSKRINFFRGLLKLDRVIVVNPNYSSIDLIKGSDGVISIAGTSLLEARIFGKAAYRVGDPEFSVVESIKDIRRIDGIIGVDQGDNLDVGRYISYCMNNGVSYDSKAAWPIYNEFIHGIKCLDQDVLRHDEIVNNLCSHFNQWLGYKLS